MQDIVVKETYDKVFAQDVLIGLSRKPKALPSKYFYDERGSQLFQAIMSLPEYYLTDCEYEIFTMQKEKLLSLFQNGAERFDLIEFGAGDGFKTKVLLRHFIEHKADFRYLPIDISITALDELTTDLAQEFPDLQTQGLHGDYVKSLEERSASSDTRKVVLFLGSNIGNFTNKDSKTFFKNLRTTLNKGDLVMIGCDLKKDPEVILKAYNDSQGVTRQFNLNLLERINTELGANFDTMQFEHYASYDPISGEVCSYLISMKEQYVKVDAIDRIILFKQWEPIHTEISRKYTLQHLEELAQSTGFKVADNLFDCKHYFVDTVWESE